MSAKENRIEDVGFIDGDRCEVREVIAAGVAETGAELARYRVRPGLDPEVDVGFYRVVPRTLADIPF